MPKSIRFLSPLAKRLRQRQTDEPKPTEEMLSQVGDPFRLLVDSVKDYAIFILDPGGYVATWNIGAEHLKSYKPSEIIGRHFSIFYPEEDLKWDKPSYELKVATEVGRF